MKWILIILAFAATTYFLTARAGKKEFARGQRVEKTRQKQILSAKSDSAYIMKFSKETLNIMRSLTMDTNPEVRFAAIELLWQMKDKESPAMIKNMFETDIDAEVKQNLVKMLEKDKSRISLSLLASALKDYDKKTKIRAIEAIGKFANKEAISILSITLTDYDEEVKIKTIKAIKSLRNDVENNRERKLKETNFKPVFRVN